MSRWNLAWLLGIPSVVLIGLALVYSAPLQPRDHNYKLVRMVVDVLAEVDQNFVRELSEEDYEKLVSDMINGGLFRLDPYSTYFSPDEYRQFQTTSDGNFGGIGIQVGFDRLTNTLKVISPMVGTPAYEAGLLAGDLILKVGDRSTEDMTMNEAVNLIQGKPGTPVTLTVLHEGANETEEVTIVRAIIEIETVMGYDRDPRDQSRWKFFADESERIAYIRLIAFNEHTAADLQAALAQVQAEGARALILDLRDNPGGLLSSAIQVSDLFLTGGAIVSTKNRHGHGRSWEAEAPGTMFLPESSHPMAILINHNSASASEIVAAALQDHGRAIVVGERSFGKGSVQKVIELQHSDPPAALKLTTDTYWRPNGRNIHRHSDDDENDEWGVSPNDGMTIELSAEERFRYLIDRRDRDLVQGKSEPRQPEPEDDEPNEPEEPFVDRVLEKALEELRGQIREVGAVPFLDLPAIVGA